MAKILKIGAVTVAAVVFVVGGIAVAASVLSERKIQRVVDIKVTPVAYANGAESIQRGKYLFASRGCMECHGADGKGREFINDPNGMYVKAPNITTGPGGVVAKYTEVDWVRTIRHGVKPSGQPLLIMPSEDYNRLTDDDFAAVVAYARNLPPVPGDSTVIRFPLIVKAAYAFGAIQDAAEKIDHNLPPPSPTPVGPTVEHGAYVANMCIGCHGAGLSGGKIPGAPPDWPAASNLTPGKANAMVNYSSADQLANMMRTGKRPNGSEVSKVMPFESLKMMSDVDVQALYAFLKALPPKDAGNR